MIKKMQYITRAIFHHQQYKLIHKHGKQSSNSIKPIPCLVAAVISRQYLPVQPSNNESVCQTYLITRITQGTLKIQIHGFLILNPIQSESLQKGPSNVPQNTYPLLPKNSLLTNLKNTAQSTWGQYEFTSLLTTISKLVTTFASIIPYTF